MQPEKNDIEREAEEIVEALDPIVSNYQKMRSTLEDGLSASGKKLRRNARCPCGSGLKFKKCCMSDMKSKLNQEVTHQPRKKKKSYEN